MTSPPLPLSREVPAFTERVLGPKQADYAVCVFVINEDGKLHRQLEAMRPFLSLADIVIADGGSTDGSVDPESLQSLGVNTLLVKTGAGKLGAQMRMAFAWAMDRGYRGVITIDGNNKDGPEALPLFVDRLNAGCDHVQGSRFLPGGVSENLPWSRWLGVKLLHAPMIRLASGFPSGGTAPGC
jgi:dolichol-phosphate mannosyltransferase